MQTIFGGIARLFSSPSVRTPLPKVSSAAQAEAVPESPEPAPEPQPEPERKRKRKRKQSANQDEDLIPTQVEAVSKSPLPERELELGLGRKQARKRKRKHSSHQDAGSPVAPVEASPHLAEPPEHEHEHEPEPEPERKRKRKRKRKHSVHQDQTNGSTKRKKTYKSDAVIRHTDDDSMYDVPDSLVAAAIDVTQDPSKAASSDTHDGTNKKSSPAERELARTWTIRRPPDVRSDGYFSNDEREITRRALVAFREDNGLSTLELVTLIQEIMPQGKRSKTTMEKTPVKFSGADSQKLWRFVYGEFENYDQKRPKTSIKKYIRRHYTVFKGFGQWTDDEDHLLSIVQSLYEQYGAQWQLISSLMGNRSSDAIRARYTNFLECGDKRNTDEWSEEEEERLRKAISAFMRKDTKKRVKDGNPPLSEYDSRDIDWSVVSRKLDHSRSRKQCQWKWASLCRQEHEERAK